MQLEIGEPVAPEVEAAVRASFARQGLMSLLGASVSEVSTGRVVIVLPSRPEVTQQLGYVHAGATTAIADSAGGYAGLTVFDVGDEVLTVELKVNLVAPARGDWLEAVGTVLKAGRTLTICRTEVYGVLRPAAASGEGAAGGPGRGRGRGPGPGPGEGAGAVAAAGSPTRTLVAAGQQTLIRVPRSA